MSKPKYKKLDNEMMKEITRYAVEQYHEEREKDCKLRVDRRLRNVKLLLRNYRELLAHSESAIYEAAQVTDEDLFDILDLMSGNKGGEYYVESIKTSAVRTRMMVEHTKEMLALYEIYCERSSKPEDKRRYRTVHRLYIDKEQWTIEQIAESESVDKSTVYKDIKDAISRLSVLIFGVDGIQ